MKKILSMVVVLAFLVASCGPSQKELQEKATADSIAKADSISLVLKQQAIDDSIKTATIEQAKADSIAKATKKVKK